VGDAGIAAPILARDGVVAGAIGVVGAADRLLAPGTRDEVIRAVGEAARAVSRDLGAGRGGPVLSALS
jgi:DNA-binding IclR family transcriptional regulator